MWLCTQHGFYSIVQKAPNEFHVRARVRRDLENLAALLKRDDVVVPPIEEWPNADYRYRFISSGRAIQWILCRLVDALAYDNFKGVISAMPDQRHKYAAYHRLWDEGCMWQARDEQGRRDAGEIMQEDINRIIRSSVDDTKCSMGYCKAKDLPLLRACLAICEEEGMKTKATHLQRRIKQLSKS